MPIGRIIIHRLKRHDNIPHSGLPECFLQAGDAFGGYISKAGVAGGEDDDIWIYLPTCVAYVLSLVRPSESSFKRPVMILLYTAAIVS